MAEFKVLNRVKGMPTSDGAGVRLNRVIGTPQLRHLDPFLMLDEFRSDKADDYIAGFPPHPHRGFETITYMLHGAMKHEDHLGNVGMLTTGGVQWMTAGEGIIHSEMPMQEDGLLWGFQFWLNLPANEKMKAPFYQDLAPEEIPEVQDDNDVLRRVVAGVSKGTKGPIQREATQPLMVDFRIQQATELEHDLPAGHKAFIYVYEGSVEVPEANVTLNRGELLAFTGESLKLVSSDKAGVLMVAGKPLEEPIVQYGPFVMNTAEEIQQAMVDYQNGVLAKVAEKV
ncbi:pirin family protein [Oceanospirillum sanctuarii]|uniref:pirin family protein n=1 Tax=Oceanospirillum sanctuarii TaxID=1434821 RepID=UPI000A3A1FF0|nr:pirin family protein [Oceanospirillum sanctuarii]